jgi:hypothetical protein
LSGQDSAGGYRIERVSLTFPKWPAARFEFNLKNEAQDYFNELKPSDIKASFDGQTVELGDGALSTATGTAHIIVLIDGSGSMVNKGAGVDKLAAAKDALLEFVDNLRPDDTVSVYAFDDEPYPVAPRADKESFLKDRIVGFTPRTGTNAHGIKHTESTDLYKAIIYALELAKTENASKLVILSDGMQDTKEARRNLETSRAAFEEYKRGFERRISVLARDKGVRLFTIAIGNKDAEWKHPDNLEYVDADTLKNITNEHAGDGNGYIHMPDLNDGTQASVASRQALLERKLASSLEKFRQAFYYHYVLELPLHDFPDDGKARTLDIVFPAGSSSSFTERYSLSRNKGDSKPDVIGVEDFRTDFLPPPRATVMPISLGAIYTLGLGGMGVLAVIPLILIKVQRASLTRAQERAVATSVITVYKKSPYVGKECPNDVSAPIKPGDVIVVCPRCGRAHHLGCWLYAKSRCMVRYCLGELPIPEAILERHGIKSA